MDKNSQCISAHRMHKNFVFRKIWDREFNIKSVHFLWTFKGISIFHKIPMMRRHKMRLLGAKFCCFLPTRSWCSIKYFCIFKLCQSLPILSKFPQDQNKLSIWKFDSSHKILIIHSPRMNFGQKRKSQHTTFWWTAISSNPIVSSYLPSVYQIIGSPSIARYRKVTRLK